MSTAELNEYTLERVKANTCAYQQLLRAAPVAGEDATAIELACGRLRLLTPETSRVGGRSSALRLKDLRFAFRLRKSSNLNGTDLC